MKKETEQNFDKKGICKCLKNVIKDINNLQKDVDFLQKYCETYSHINYFHYPFVHSKKLKKQIETISKKISKMTDLLE